MHGSATGASAGRRRSRRTGTQEPGDLAYHLATPAVELLNGMGNLLLKPFGIPPANEAGHAEGELRALLLQSQDEGLIHRADRELPENVFAFGDARAREIMTPRPQIEFVSTDDDIATVARHAMCSGHTRLPLREPDRGLDTAVWVIHVKDLLEAVLDQRDVTLTDVARPLARASESMLLSELMRDLRLDRQHIALVADEHGTTTGLVTLEDILEELVGEIEDEFDTRASEQFTLDGSAFLIDGSASIRMLEQELGVAHRDDRS